MRKCYLAAWVLGLMVTACASNERVPAPPPSRPVAVVPSLERGLSAEEFIAANASIDLFVIRSSELALQRSSSARVRDYATRMVEAHKGTSAQLSLAGRRLNLLPSAILRPAHQAMLDALSASPSFDADFVRDQRLVHQYAVSLDSAYAANGKSPTLRPVAAAALPIEQRHLRLLASL